MTTSPRPTSCALALALALSFGAPASQATVITYRADMDGPSESPPVGSPGTGVALVTYDSVAHTLKIKADWTGLTGTTTVAHIHCCTTAPSAGTVGVAVTPGTLPGFPAGVTAGSYEMTVDLTDTTSYTAGFLTAGGGTVAGAEMLLISGFDDLKAYFNIHSSFVASGEIRGFLAQVPEPASLALLTLGLVGLGLSRRKQA